MITWHIDIGQLIVAVLLLLISIIAWFIRKEILNFGTRLDKHEVIILELVKDVQQLIGRQNSWDAIRDRRK